MDIKMDSIGYIILFLIPGFIFYKVAGRYVTRERHEGNEKLIGILAASAFLHAVALPAFIYCVHVTVRWQLGLGLILLLLIWPTLAGLAFGWFSGGRWGEWTRRVLGANPREPTAWGYFWGQRKPVIVRAILDDGSVVVGASYGNSSASSPETEDLYLEKQYQIGDDGCPTGLKENTLGCWIPAARLRWVEFIDAVQTGDDTHDQEEVRTGLTASESGGPQDCSGKGDIRPDTSQT